MAETIVKNTKILTPTELRRYGEARYELLQNPEVRDHLKARFLPATLKRNASPEASLRNMVASADVRNRNSAYVVLDSDEALIGMASRQPNLALWNQRIIGPTRLMRAMGKIGLPTSRLIADITNNCANVSAWVRPRDFYSEPGNSELIRAFNVLRVDSPAPVWTIVPHAPVALPLHSALLRAGYEMRVQPGPLLYDDLEAVGLQQAPPSRLYVSEKTPQHQ